MHLPIDNSNLPDKLNLRRHFLDKYHAGMKPTVFECCEGEGVLWRTLRKEYELGGIWGVDLKSKPGRLKMDSVRIVGQPGLGADIIDIDTYGEPWAHWFALLPNLNKSTTVFLTSGIVLAGGGKVSNAFMKAFGLPPHTPRSLAAKARRIAASYFLTDTAKHDVSVTEAVEAATRTQQVRYLGVRLEPKPRKESTA